MCVCVLVVKFLYRPEGSVVQCILLLFSPITSTLKRMFLYNLNHTGERETHSQNRERDLLTSGMWEFIHSCVGCTLSHIISPRLTICEDEQAGKVSE